MRQTDTTFCSVRQTIKWAKAAYRHIDSERYYAFYRNEDQNVLSLADLKKKLSCTPVYMSSSILTFNPVLTNVH